MRETVQKISKYCPESLQKFLRSLVTILSRAKRAALRVTSGIISSAACALASTGSMLRASLRRIFQKRTFAYALVIVPVGSLGTSSALLSDRDPGSFSYEIPQSVFVSAFEISDSYPEATTNDIKPSSYPQASIDLDEEIIFQFTDDYQATVIEDMVVSVSPRIATTVTWSQDGREIQISPQVTWEPNTLYSIALSHGPDKPAIYYHVQTRDMPQISGNTVAGEEKKFIVEQGKTFEILFDRDIAQFDFRAIARGGGRDGIAWATEVLADRRALRVTLQNAIQTRTELEFITYAKHKKQSDNAYFPIGNLSFVGVPQQPSEWPEEITERAELAVQKTLPKVTEGKYIDINLTARVTTLFEDGIATRSIINSPGAQETPTITGEFRIENKLEKPLSNMFGVYLPNWMAFTPDGLYGIHGLVEWPPDHPDFPDAPEGGKESVGSIDSAVSAGCVRHDDLSSVELYEWAEVGTPVIIY